MELFDILRQAHRLIKRNHTNSAVGTMRSLQTTSEGEFQHLSGSEVVDGNEKSTIFILRATFAFLLASALLSSVSVLWNSQIFPQGLTKVYISSLSTIISFVAAYHYYEIIKVRSNNVISANTESKIASLRHSDWVITMPILVLKLHALFNNTGHTLLLGSTNVSALCAGIMIILGAFVRLGLDELSGFANRPTNCLETVAGVLCYIVSTVLMCFLIVDLEQLRSGVDHDLNTRLFFMVWPFYAAVAFLAVFWRMNDDVKNVDRMAQKTYPTNLALVKDAAYAILDVISKGIFAWYTSSATFGVSPF